MILQLFTRRRPAATIPALYGTIVAQARSPIFYTEYAVPDTVNGRFDMIVLHLALLIDRTEIEGAGSRTLGQDLFDHFCLEMDDNLREMGIGDLKVPKEMQKVAEAFYGRRAAYRSALAQAGDGTLAAALVRNVYAGAADRAPQAIRLAAYVRTAVHALATQTGLPDGALAWPDPHAISIVNANHAGTSP
jgi:cytochrome b pre-mRNA-processing protein 3